MTTSIDERRAAATPPLGAGTRAVSVIAAGRRTVAAELREVWLNRELLYFLTWRDLKVRYRQTLLGGSWIVLQPLLATLIFTVVFGRLARIPSDQLPYPVFALAGLLPWNYFAGTLNRAGSSLVNNAPLVTKIYFPRLIVPLAGTLNGLVDFGVALLVLGLMMAAYGLVPGYAVLTVPLFLALAMTAGFGTSLWLTAAGVRYRDVNQVLPFLVQVWMYASPVVYPSSLVPAQWRTLVGLNPMAGVIEGFRWALLGGPAPPVPLLLLSVAVAVALLAGGLAFFRSVERTFADEI